MSFLISKYKGIYRLQTEYDQSTKQFPRNLSGTFLVLLKIQIFTLNADMMFAFIIMVKNY